MSELFNVEAEQAVLGALLLDNDLLGRVSFLTAQHFYERVHARIFGLIAAQAAAGRLASPITLKFLLADDEGLAEIGGAKYLARLAAAASTSALVDHAQVIRDLWARRDLAGALSEAQERVQASDGGAIPDIATELEHRLAVNLNAGGGKPLSRSWTSTLTASIRQINDAAQGDAPPGVSSGYKAIDKLVGSLRPGRVYLLAGRPSMGKTAVALNIAYRVASAGSPVIMPSLEMPETDLVNRSLSQMLREDGRRLSYHALERGQIDEDGFRHMIELAKERRDLPIDFIDRDHSELSRMMLAIRSRAKARPPGLIVIDYLQLIDVHGQRQAIDKINAASKAVKRLAMSMDVPVMLLSQLNREVETRDEKRPRLSDLRGSGEIEEDADTVMFVYRHEYYLTRDGEPKKGKEADKTQYQADLAESRDWIELILAKNRGGPTGTAKLRCEIACNYLCDKDEYQAIAPTQREIDFA